MSIGFTRGDTVPIALVVTRLNNGVVTPVDITDAKIWLTAKRRVSDGEPVFQKGTGNTDFNGIVLDEPTEGTATITILPTDTEDLPPKLVYLVYDVQMEEDTVITTIASGQFAVTPDVTVAS